MRDRKALVLAAENLVKHLDPEPEREGLRETPSRIASSLFEMTEGYRFEAAEILKTQFDSPSSNELIVLRAIPFVSLCEHHLLPFHGTATVGYLPNNGRVVGLSKLARLVDMYARRLQLQERLTSQVATALMEHLDPAGAGCILRATHSCMSFRGVGKAGEMVTSCLLGSLRVFTEQRAEFLALERR